MGMALSSVMVMVMVPVMTRNCCQQERSGSLAMFQLQRHGSIRSDVGSLNSPESGSDEEFIPPLGNSKPISSLSSIGITKIPGPSNGPNLPIKSWLQSSASATKRSRHYAANFRFT